MSVYIEIGHSRLLIDKAEARLAYQQATVRRLGFDVDPRFAATANETLMLMEAKLAKLRADHASLLEERGPAARAPAAVPPRRVSPWSSARRATSGRSRRG